MVTAPPSAVASTSATWSAEASLMRSNPSDMTRSRAPSRNPASESPPFAAIEAEIGGCGCWPSSATLRAQKLAEEALQLLFERYGG